MITLRSISPQTEQNVGTLEDQSSMRLYGNKGNEKLSTTALKNKEDID